MKDETRMKERQQPTIESQKKRPYQQPLLRLYGSVATLTAGVGSDNNESSGVGGGAQKMGTSDRATKQNIVLAGTHPLGIGLYLFEFKPEFRDSCGHGRQFGVMADEVERIMPEAIYTHPDGYKMVDYAALGITHVLH